MGRKKRPVEEEAKKEPHELAGSGGCDGDESPVDYGTHSITEQPEKSSTDSVSEKGSGRHFWYVVYPSETYLREHYPDCPYDGSAGYGTAPDDWIEQLANTGLAFHVSALHDRDLNPDGKPKKPHWHVIISWGNSTTYKAGCSLCDLLNCPRPQLLRSVTGAYRYARHLDNPEKYQYTDPGTAYNGWTPPLDSVEVARIKKELVDIVIQENVTEYAELLVLCGLYGPEYFDVASNNTVYCDRLCTSYWRNQQKVLRRYRDTLPAGELRDAMSRRLANLRRNNREKNDGDAATQAMDDELNGI